MELRKLGKSDVSVTPMAFGAWAIGGWMWGNEEQVADNARALSFTLSAGEMEQITAAANRFTLAEEKTV